MFGRNTSLFFLKIRFACVIAAALAFTACQKSEFIAETSPADPGGAFEAAACTLSFKTNPIKLTAYATKPFDLDLRTLLTCPEIDEIVWSFLPNGLPPAWVHLDSSNNRMFGNPGITDAGKSTFLLGAQKDDTGAIAQVEMTVLIPVEWTQPSLNFGKHPQDVLFQFDLKPFVITPIPEPIVFSASELPGWMVLDPITGILSGTPKRADVGAYSGIVITATGPDGASANISASGEVLKVVKPPDWISNPITLANAFEDSPYVAGLIPLVNNYEGTPLTFSIISGPSWIALSGSNLAGTPRFVDVGPVSMTVSFSTVIDGVTYQASTVLKFNVIHVNHPPQFTQGSVTLPHAISKLPYTQSLAGFATDVDLGDVFTFSSSNLPSWLSLSAAGVLTGTPVDANMGNHTFHVQVHDTSGVFAPTALTVSVRVIVPPKFKSPIILPNAFEDMTYSINLLDWVNNPENAPLAFSSSNLPSWLSFSSPTTLSGKPGATDVATSTFSVRLSASIGGLAFEDTGTFSLKVVHVNHAPTWLQNPINLPNATAGFAYAHDVSQYTFDPDVLLFSDTLTFQLLSGPQWISLSPSGNLSGTPTSADYGAHTLLVQVHDTVGLFADATAAISIYVRPFWKTNPIDLGHQLVGYPFSFDLKPFVDHPDIPSLTFSVVGLPAWMTLSSAGVLSGTPQQSDVGAYSGVQLSVTDPVGNSQTTLAFGKVIEPPRWVGNPIKIKDALVPEPYSFDLTSLVINPADTALVFQFVSEVPAWLKLSASGMLSGTPTEDDIDELTLIAQFSTVIDGHSFQFTTTLFLSVHPDFTKCVANSGKLDQTFGNSGIVDLSDHLNAMAVQADGKVVVAGYSKQGGKKLLLMRFNKDGSPDASFGDGGKTVTDVPGSDTQALALAVSSTGRICLAGEVNSPNDPSTDRHGQDVVVACYSTSGILDTSFSGDGWIIEDIAQTRDSAGGIAFDAAGNIVINGSTRNSSGAHDNLFVARYLPDGSADTSFGQGGMVITDTAGGGETAKGLAIQKDGRIVIAASLRTVPNSDPNGNGAAQGDVLAVRFNVDGSLDSTFGADGKLIVNVGGDEEVAKVALQRDGRILISGSTRTNGNTNTLLLRLTQVGALDETFAVHGIASSDVLFDDDIRGLAIQRDGRILIAGNVHGSPQQKHHLLLMRYLPDGTLDRCFGNEGIVIDETAGDNFGRDVAMQPMQPGSKILLLGEEILERYLP